MILGFGINVAWDWDKSEIPKGHTISFMRALAFALEGIGLRVTFPRWLLSLTKRGREGLCAYEEMGVSHHSTLYKRPNLKT